MRAQELSRRSTAVAELRSQDWIQHIAWIERVDSTSNYARRWLAGHRSDDANLAPQSAIRLPDTGTLPALFIADQQTAGRGRGSNQWWSPVGCLMMTLVVDSNTLPVQPSDWPKLSLVCGVAAAEASEHTVPDLNVQLKWPNDLHVAGRKLGGILIEAVHSSQLAQPPIWLIGIGINVCIAWEKAPESLRERATCLASESGRGQDCETLLVALVESLQHWLGRWKAGVADWQAQWSRRSLLNQRMVQVRIPPNDIFRGRCEGLDSQGYLLVRSECELRSIRAGEIISWAN